MNSDNEAWKEVEAKFVNPLCQKLIADRENPSDHAARILSTIYQRARGRPPSEFKKTWLFRTIFGEVKKGFRKQKVQISSFEGGAEPLDKKPSVLEQIINDEIITMLRKFHSELTGAQRLAIATKFPVWGEKISVEEAARRLGLCPSRIRQLHHEAIALLKKKFAAIIPDLDA